MDNDLSRDPVVDPKTPLDGGCISNILAGFLRCEPSSRIYVLPTFRLKQLCSRLKAINSCTGDSNRIESLGCVLAIAMHYSFVPNYDDTVLMECITLLETVMSECILTMNCTYKKMELVHPCEYLKNKNSPSLFTSLTECMSICKDILRDLIRQVRSAREPSKKPSLDASGAVKKEKIPLDGYQAHSMYVFSCLALGHVASVLADNKMINSVPGLMESIVLMTFLVPTKDNSSEESQKPKIKIRGEERENKYNDIMPAIHQMGGAIMNSFFNERNLHELRVVHARMAKTINHPHATFSRIRSESVGRYLEEIEKTLEFENKTGSKTSAIKSFRFSLEDCIDAGGPILGGFLSNPKRESIAANGEDPFKVLEKQLVGVHSQKKKQESNLINNIDKEVEKFWEMKRHFQQMYIVLRPLRHSASIKDYYPRGYYPPIKSFALNTVPKSTNFLPIKQVCDECESARYYSDEHFTSRILDPSAGLYWIAVSIVEYLYQKTIKGEGFNPPDKVKAKELQGQVSKLRHERMSKSYPEKRSLLDGLEGIASITDKLKVAMTEAPIEVELNNYEKMLREKPQKAPREERLVSVDSILKDGIHVLRQVKTKKIAIKTKLDAINTTAMTNFYKSMHSSEEGDMFIASRPDSPENTISNQIFNEGFELSPSISAGNSRPGSKMRQKTPQQLLPEIDPLIRVFGVPEDHMKDIGSFRRKLRAASVIAEINHTPNTKVSAIWSKKPALSANKVFSMKPRNSSELAKTYAADIHSFQKVRAEEEKTFRLSLEDEQEAQVSKSQEFQLMMMRETRRAEQKLQEDTKEVKALAAKLLKEQRHQEQKELMKANQQLEVLNEQEKLRLKALNDWKRSEKDKEDAGKNERHEIELMRLSKMADEKEAKEQKRRQIEEDRMRYLEGRRKIVEDIIYGKLNEKQNELDEKRKKFKEEKHNTIARVRMGNFKWHNGVLGYYDDVRKKPVAWVQYEDDNGVPYYLDPLNNRTTYELPQDADIRHNSDDNREAYDAIYGYGAYDAMIADRAYKDAVNRDGGWYDEKGKWVVATGYYDDNYEWVGYEGYFDVKGRFIKYAKVQGGLDFMV